MKRSDQRLPRLLALVPWLRTHPAVTRADAAAAFGVTEAELLADIELLFCCGLPGGSPGDLIDIALEGEHITVLDPQTLDRPLRLTADEATALLVAVRALADLPGLQERDALERARGKLERAAGVAALGAATVDVALEAPEAVLSEVRRGIAEGRRLHLSYLVETRDEVTERDVDPLQVVLQTGRFYLEGWCHRAEAVRLFRADRIIAIKVLDQLATPPPGLLPRELAEGVFTPLPSDTLVELELLPAARWVADYYACETVDELSGGRLRVALRTPDTEWMVGLALRLAGHGRILAPPELAAQVIAAATAALRAYGE